MFTDGVGALPARAELRLPPPALLAARRRPRRGRGHLARRRVAVAEVRGAEARRDPRLGGAEQLRPTRGPRRQGLVRRAEHDGGGEALADGGARAAGLLPGVPQAHLARRAAARLPRVRRVELVAVRVAGAAAEEGAALVTPHPPRNTRHTRGGGGGGGGGGGADPRGWRGHAGAGAGDLAPDVVPAHAVTQRRGADTRRDGVRLQGRGHARAGGLHRALDAAEQDAGGEALPDDGGLGGGLPPGVVEARLARVAGLHLGGVQRVEGVAVGRVRGEEAAAGPALHL